MSHVRLPAIGSQWRLKQGVHPMNGVPRLAVVTTIAVQGSGAATLYNVLSCSPAYLQRRSSSGTSNEMLRAESSLDLSTFTGLYELDLCA